ncbi:MAG: hypothetical protein JXA03_01860 [Bacteroidales bacterium]|nr:hypothetical protein [Bacteroidales bacterium]
MKKISFISAIILMTLPSFIMSQPLPYGLNGGEGLYPAGGYGNNPELHWKLTNPYVWSSGVTDYFAFDIELAATCGETYFKELDITLSYNNLAFGSNIHSSNKLFFIRQFLTESATDYSISGFTDVNSNTVNFKIIRNTNDPAKMKALPQTNSTVVQYAGLIHFNIIIADINELPQIALVQPVMDGHQYFTTIPCPAPALYGEIPGYVNHYHNMPLNTNMNNKVADWTWIYYIYESEGHAPELNALRDINEIESNGSIWRHVNYLVYFDQTVENGNNDGIYYIKQDPNQAKPTDLSKNKMVSHKIHNGFGNMNDPNVLKTFLKDFVAVKYPAERYGVIFWDHGHGIFKKDKDPLIDGIFSEIELWELKNPLNEFKGVIGDKIDLLGFSCCLMAYTETVHMMADLAKVVMAPEMTEIDYHGWEWGTSLLHVNNNPAIDEKSIASIIVNDTRLYFDNLATNPPNWQRDFTLSASETQTYINNYLPSEENFTKELIKNLGKFRPTIIEARNATWYPKYGGKGDPSPGHEDERDIGHFAKFIRDNNLLPDPLQNAANIFYNEYRPITVFDEDHTSFYNGGYNDKVTGLKKWFPLNVFDPANADKYEKYTNPTKLNLKNNAWTKFLEALAGSNADIKINLEGPFTAGYMSNILNNYGLIPLNQPFSGAPWNYDGEESLISIPDPDIVDWVLIEIRESVSGPDNATSDSIISRTVAFLKTDGTIVDWNSGGQLVLYVPKSSNYYIVLHHRNHLPIMSSQPLIYDQNLNTYSYDFTGNPDLTYKGLNAVKVVSGECVMLAGDGNADGQVNTGDKIDVWAVESGLSGYLNGDFNLDGEVNLGDKNDCWVPNVGRGSQVPE